MAPGPQLTGAGLMLHRRVMEETDGAGVGRMLVNEEVLRRPHGERHGLHQRRARPGAGVVEVQDRFAKTGHGNVPTVQQPETGLVQAEGFLEIPGLFRIQVLDGDADVARDDVQIGPSDGFLDVPRQGEELPGLRRHPFEQSFGQRQVGDVEEAELAAGRADLRGHAAACSRIAADGTVQSRFAVCLTRSVPGNLWSHVCQ